MPARLTRYLTLIAKFKARAARINFFFAKLGVVSFRQPDPPPFFTSKFFNIEACGGPLAIHNWLWQKKHFFLQKTLKLLRQHVI
jgi:hypothetical protein